MNERSAWNFVKKHCQSARTQQIRDPTNPLFAKAPSFKELEEEGPVNVIKGLLKVNL